MRNVTTGWTIHRVQRREVEVDEIRHRKPSLDHGPQAIKPGTVLVDPDDNDRVLAAYLPFEPVDAASLRRHATAVRVPVQDRTGGLRVRALTFGALPRLEVRGRDACTSAGLNRDHPELYRLLAAQAAPLERLYETLSPGVFEGHASKAEEILTDWRLPGSKAFTGGVLNRDSNIGYHYDTGNFSDVFSAMIGLRRAMDGGELVLPEFGVHFPIADGTASFFDGQAAIHGVTDLRTRNRSRAHRITIVYYSTKRLWTCLEPTEELHRAAGKRTERAVRRAHPDDPAVPSTTDEGAPA